ncbi:MAG: hypothetical protein LUF87_00100 [Alistipes sp.]|nr:hypothetical protein [Alistipes sp.]
MQADVTKQSFGVIFTQFVLLALLFWAGCYYGTGEQAAMTSASVLPGPSGWPGYLPGNYIGPWTMRFPLPTVVLSLVIIFFNAFLITKTVTQNLVYPIRTYLPCIFYLLVAGGICFPGYDLAAVLAAYLMVRASAAFISSFVRKVSFGTTFRGAFLIGMTPLLEPQNAIYILLVPIATMIFRRCGRETIVAVLGSLMPALITAYLWWAFGGEFTGVFIEVWQQFTAGVPAMVSPQALSGGLETLYGMITEPAGILRIGAVALMVVTLLLSVISFFSMSADMRTRAYKINIFALWFLLLGFISLALPSRCCGNFPVLAIPAAVIAPAFFVRHRSLVPLALYILTLTAAAAASILPATGIF